MSTMASQINGVSIVAQPFVNLLHYLKINSLQSIWGCIALYPLPLVGLQLWPACDTVQMVPIRLTDGSWSNGCLVSLFTDVVSKGVSKRDSDSMGSKPHSNSCRNSLIIGIYTIVNARWHVFMYPTFKMIFILIYSGTLLFMRPANKRQRYNATSSLIGWAHTQNDPCLFHRTGCMTCNITNTIMKKYVVHHYFTLFNQHVASVANPFPHVYCDTFGWQITLKFYTDYSSRYGVKPRPATASPS